MDAQRIKKLIGYILACAGQQDFPDNELGPIHIIKYIYLADLAYAEEHEGQTYTGAEWKFHNFGPWSVEVFRQIEPAVYEIGAKERTVSSTKFEGDFVRWSVSDEELLKETDDTLPLDITLALSRAIREFSNDTSGLLSHVYSTVPMLKAAPEEKLVFESHKIFKKSYPDKEASQPTHRQMKKRKELLKEIRSKVRALIEEQKSKRASRLTTPQPRYDEVFHEGVKCLDSLSDESIKALEGELEFSDNIWKSTWRYDPDVSR